MDGLNSCDSVERMMAFLTATINVLTIDQLVQMVANLNHNRYIDTFPDGRLEQRAVNLTAVIQMYERGGNPSPRVNQLERENVRLRDVNQMLNNKYRILKPTESPTESPADIEDNITVEYNEPPGLYFFHDDGQGGVRKIYEDGHSSNDDNEPAEFYTEYDGAGGFRRIYQDSYYTRDDGKRIYTDGHESNDDVE